jgi:hypothetical protein
MYSTEKAFPIRGYYMIISRTQAWGLEDWKKFVDRMAEDGCNFLILWIGGGFPSKKFPETWQYNIANRNVQENFAGKLIDHAHDLGIEVVLGFTPHAYDGVNQFGMAHPEYAARQADGSITPVLGIHSMGRMLCPSKPPVREFMHDYIHELFFDFYPNADGLFFEHSDYGHCECLDCRDHYLEREWEFVNGIASEIWSVKPNARMVIYPQYYQRKVAEPDSRYTLFFTPHSTEITSDVRELDCDKLYWQMSFGEPLGNLRSAAKTAADNGMQGFIASMEAFSHEGEVNGRRLMFEPYDIPWKQENVFPFDDLIPKVLRWAFRVCTSKPLSSDREFLQQMAVEAFGSAEEVDAASDLLTLFELVQSGYRDFALRNALVHPEDFERIYPEDKRAEAEADFRRQLGIVREIADKYQGAEGNKGEMGRIAAWIVKRWETVRPA